MLTAWGGGVDGGGEAGRSGDGHGSEDGSYSGGVGGCCANYGGQLLYEFGSSCESMV